MQSRNNKQIKSTSKSEVYRHQLDRMSVEKEYAEYKIKTIFSYYALDLGTWKLQTFVYQNV